MRNQTLRALLIALCAVLLPFTVTPVSAQTSDAKAAPGAAEAGKSGQRRIDEFAEASRQIPGPAGNPECVWLGRRVVSLLWRDDLDTAFRHLDLYDRFGCPAPHLQQAFRCVVRQGSIDPKAPDTLHARVHACWMSPSAPAQPAAAAIGPTGSTSATR
ncbi:MAG TPA: beta-1-3, beta-1-6-glucan biosynthesis protein [Xanthobacteraceae bacterium]|nr:beta-1-3, beta-1-6-glucan biosynthesis protein [Xanthobacteraceae bacterium]